MKLAAVRALAAPAKEDANTRCCSRRLQKTAAI